MTWRIVTAKPARSQIIGGVVMGIGMALNETRGSTIAQPLVIRL